MVISHIKKYIFIHVYKVAGGSIRNHLHRYGNASLLTKVDKLKSILGMKSNIFSDNFNDHIRANELKEQIPSNIFDSYFKFAFVRNPWDWQVSLYHYTLETPSHPQHQFLHAMANFEEYIEWRVNNEVRFQKDFVCDEEGNLLVDFIGKFENLYEDYNAICKTLNIPDAKLPHRNKSNHKNYKKYYNSITKELIAKAFKKDIDFFEYTF